MKKTVLFFVLFVCLVLSVFGQSGKKLDQKEIDEIVTELSCLSGYFIDNLRRPNANVSYEYSRIKNVLDKALLNIKDQRLVSAIKKTNWDKNLGNITGTISIDNFAEYALYIHEYDDARKAAELLSKIDNFYVQYPKKMEERIETAIRKREEDNKNYNAQRERERKQREQEQQLKEQKQREEEQRKEQERLAAEKAQQRAADAGYVRTKDNADGTLTVTGFIFMDSKITVPDRTTLVIPTMIEGKTVTAIADSAFENGRLRSVTIPDSVTTIGKNAFSRNYLTDVKIPDSTTIIGEKAFYNNQLTSITIPNSITTIGDEAFSGNKITYLTIPNSVTSIGSGAFSGNNLTSIIIPNSVTIIGRGAFSGNKLSSVTISNSITTIQREAFSGNNLTSVIIPNSVTTIESEAFSSNNLTSVIIPNSVITIEQEAFSKNKLTSINIPNSVKFISGFNDNQLTNVTIPNSVTTIGWKAFYGNRIKSVIIPNSVTVIGDYAFYGNPLTEIKLGNGITKIGSEFSGVPIMTVIIGARVDVEKVNFRGPYDDFSFAELDNFRQEYLNNNGRAGRYVRTKKGGMTQNGKPIDTWARVGDN